MMPFSRILSTRSRRGGGSSSSNDSNRSTTDRSAAAGAPQPVERLEQRTLLSVSTSSAGWTTVGKSSDTRVIYVSSSDGSDKNSGLSASSPVKTLAKAASLVRSGRPDWLLLERGNTWKESFGAWSKSGRSASEPILIGAYGSGSRPLLKTGKSSGFNTNGRSVSNVVISGIAFHANSFDPYSSDYVGSKPTSYGVRAVGPVTNLTIENCSFDAYLNNVTLGAWDGSPKNVKIRRNVLTDAHTAGIYAADVSGLKIEGNVLDHNGWNERTNVNGTGHNIYLQATTSGVSVTGNVIARAGSHGLQARGGGTVTGNLFYANGVGMSFGVVNGAAAKAGGVSGTVSGNVFLGTKKISGRGWGYAIEVGNTRRDGNTAIRDNVFAHSGSSTTSAILLTYGSSVSNNSKTVGINDLTIASNVVYDWDSGIGFNSNLVPGGSGSKALNDLVVKDNAFQNSRTEKLVWHSSKVSKTEEKWSNNTYWDDTSTSRWFQLGDTHASLATWRSKVESTAKQAKISYKSPNRGLDSYNDSIGGSSSASAFLTAARKLAQDGWKSSLTADRVVSYIRAGFNKTTTSSTGSTPAGTTEPASPPPPTSTSGAPKVLSSTTSATKLTFRFSEDVSASLGLRDLVLTNKDTGKRVDADAWSLNYDKATNTATWTFPGLSSDRLAAGKYSARLMSSGITDASGNHLLPGGDSQWDYVVIFNV